MGDALSKDGPRTCWPSRSGVVALVGNGIGPIGAIRVSSLRRLVVAILLVLFAPASIVAAMPLVLCHASDGSHALEWRGGTADHADTTLHHHGGEHDDGEHAGEFTGWHSHDGGCDDHAIVSSGTSTRSDKACVGAKPKAYPAVLVEPMGGDVRTYLSDGRYCARIPASSERLEHLRTVILLI